MTRKWSAIWLACGFALIGVAALCVSDPYVLGSSGGLLADNAIIFEAGCVLGGIGCFIIALHVFFKG